MLLINYKYFFDAAIDHSKVKEYIVSLILVEIDR